MDKQKPVGPGANTLSNTITQDQILPGAVKPRHLAVSPQAAGVVYYSDGTNFVGIIPAGLAANRPTAGTFKGQTYFATDTLVLSAWTGALWKNVTLS